MTKTQRWDWAVSLELSQLSDFHLQAAYKLNWDNLCKFDNCRKNCKKILCLACFDRSWIDSQSANSSNYDNFETTNCEQKRADLKSFVGLKNLGATCYVNCLLQLWFHNPALRKAVYEWDKDGGQVCLNINNSDEHMITEEGDSNFDINKNSVVIIPSPKAYPENEPSTPNKKASNMLQETKLQNSATGFQELQMDISESRPKSHQADTDFQVGKELVKAKPIEQLQLIFARLQFTNKKSIDPFSFIDSLALNTAEQQDAQEFGNLFMEYLEKSFANQKNSFVSKIIQSQFCGSYSYATICDHCKHSSLSDSKFYELDLSIQNLETLHDCLNDYFRPVPLDGKYNCSHCQKAQSARRKIILKSLPPTLNLQLLRFIYDVQRNVRQKLNSFIIFPEILDMSPYLTDSSPRKASRSGDDASLYGHLSSNGNSLRSSSLSNKSHIYILTAVLIHRGSSPHSGHYIAHIKDRITKDWYKFNDDSVERIGPQLQVSTDGESITIVDDKKEANKFNGSAGLRSSKLESKNLKSKTAYMLVYQAQDNEALTYPSDHSEGWVLPDHLQMSVAQENSRSDELFESLQIAKEVDQQTIELRKVQVRRLYEKLVCRDPSDKFEFIDKIWLQNWLTDSTSSVKFPPIDNSHLLCNHDKLDFRKLDSVKCVRSEGADLLYKEFGGGPRLVDAMCRQCVELEVKLIQLKEKMKEQQKFISSQSKFKVDGYDFADAYIVGKKSYRDWQALVMCQFEKSHPELLNRKKDNKSPSNNQQHSSDEDDQKQATDATDKNLVNNDENANSDSDDEALEKFVFNSDILCNHNGLIHDTNAWRIVPKEVWLIFKSYFGNDPSRPLIEHNANTIMCAECKRQEVKQQEIGDVQRAIAFKQKSRLPDLFHNRKRASWCSMLPADEYFALDRVFLSRWQRFIRNPQHREPPDAIRNKDRLICEHDKCLYSFSNSNPILPECPFILISASELEGLKSFYSIDEVIKFYIDPDLAEQKLKMHLATKKSSPVKKNPNSHPDNQGPNEASAVVSNFQSSEENSCPRFYDQDTLPLSVFVDQKVTISHDTSKSEDEFDPSDVDWSECVVSKPDFCSECHEMLKQDEIRKLLNYESATIYITKVENVNSSSPFCGPSQSANGITGNLTIGANIDNENCDNELKDTANKGHLESISSKELTGYSSGDVEMIYSQETYPFKRRRKIYTEDEANDFIPPGAGRQTPQASPANASMLRRTTRRNRNREQAYTIKPNQTLLELKKEIFSRCQVLPVDQRLFLNDVLLDDNGKTMSDLKIVPNCSLKLEVDKPVNDNIDLIEDEASSRKSCAQPETGFKGSLLLSNSHL